LGFRPVCAAVGGRFVSWRRWGPVGYSLLVGREWAGLGREVVGLSWLVCGGNREVCVWRRQREWRPWQVEEESRKIGSLRGGEREGLCLEAEEEENQKGRALCYWLKEEMKMGEQCGEGGLSGWFRRDNLRKKMAGAKMRMRLLWKR